MLGDWTIDLHHCGRPGYVAAQVLVSREGPVLVDTGPASTLDRLEAGLHERGFRLKDLRAVLLSHIHLDHAGASGQIAAAAPEIAIYVHRRGARHLADPSKLLESARMIYGNRLESLWGEMIPTPADRLVPLEDGRTIEIGGRRFLGGNPRTRPTPRRILRVGRRHRLSGRYWRDSNR